MSDDALNCPNCEVKMNVVQGAAFIHENVLCYWRRKRCRKCGRLEKTVEVPAGTLNLFQTKPDPKDMQ